MAKREGFWFFAVVCLLLLLLSALVKSPETVEHLPVPLWETVRAEPVALSATSFQSGENTVSAAGLRLFGMGALWIAAALLSVPLQRRGRDANGRWIRTKRYASSVYQVFRTEMAGG